MTVLDNWGNGGRNFTRTIPFDKLALVMTAAEVQAKRDAGLLFETADQTGFILRKAPEDDTREETKAEQNDRLHREHLAGGSREEVTTTPAAVTSPAPIAAAVVDQAPPAVPAPAGQLDMFGSTGKPPIAAPCPFAAMKEQLRQGVQVVAAPQLFPTPAELAARMVDLAEIEPGQSVLEPSGGTGRLLDPLFNDDGTEWKLGAGGRLVVVEKNHSLAAALRRQYVAAEVRQADFLECNGDLGTFDRILMNPPFVNGADIAHIRHAAAMLRPGGRLVALCANGPRQQGQLLPLVSHWEDLPADSFAAQGTGVNVALLVIDR